MGIHNVDKKYAGKTAAANKIKILFKITGRASVETIEFIKPMQAKKNQPLY